MLKLLMQYDSLDLKKIDSLVHKTTEIAHSVSLLSDKLKIAPWIPFIAAVITALLFWIGQHIDRRAKSSAEKRDRMLNLYSECEVLLNKMKNSLKQIAIHKNKRELWWVCYDNTFEAAKSEGVEHFLEKKYLEDYHKSAETVIQEESDFNTINSEYLGKVCEFLVLSKTNDIDTGFIINFQIGSLEEAESLPDDQKEGELRSLSLKNIELLMEKYSQRLKSFYELNNSLRIIAEKKQ